MSEKAKNTFYIILFIAFIIGFIQSCAHEHDWIDATCTEPRTCSSCQKTEGDPLGHDYQGATCTSLGTCSRCGESGGSYISHEWTDATCTKAEHCAVCGEKRHSYSMPLGHKWTDATCTTPKTCTQCGATEGTPHHNLISYYWETTIEPTCQSKGEESQSCRSCGEVQTRVVPTVDHKAGDWQITQQATASTPGIKVKSCVMCGAEIDRTEYTLPAPSSSPNSGSGGGGTGGGGNGGGSGGSTGGGGNVGNFNTYDNADQQNTSASYVLNTNTKRFHYPSCKDVKKISPKNYATSNQSRSDLIASGYKACGHCKP